MNERLQAWLSDESGQDVIEYLLLGAFVAIASWVGVLVLENTIRTTFQSWDAASQDAWEPLPPVAAGS